MAKPIYFVPSQSRNAAENMSQFIEFVQEELRCFPSVEWDAVSWNLSRYFSNRANPSSEVRMAWRGFADKNQKRAQPLQPFLGDFARAYICYSHVIRPTVNVPRKRLDPFKALDAALDRLGLEVTGFGDAVVFNLAQELIREKWNAATAYRASKELEKVADFLDDHFMTAVRLSWRTSLHRPCDLSWRVSEDATKMRKGKMPSARALHACAELFNLSVRPKDQLVASTVPILLSGPNRIGEVLTLPFDAMVEEIFDGRTQFGLRWSPEKDGPKQVKWVLPSFADVVRKAFGNILRITSEARAMALWYTKNKSIYLPSGLEQLRQQSILNAEELCLLLGLQGKAENCARQWCSRRRISYLNNPFQVWLRDVEREILSSLPVGFPWRHRPTRLRYCDALFVVPKNFFHDGNRPICNVMFEAVTVNHINTALGGHERHGKSSIFSRFGLVEEDGTPISITSHAFRHWLNTLAQRGGLSQIEIAIWSGRKSVRENAAYDHLTANELLDRVKQTLPEHRVSGPLKAAILSNQELAEVISANMAGAVHHTEVGICVHDYTMLPCQLHMDCINCHESICIKGDHKKTARIVELRKRAKESMCKAEESEKASYFGADRWLIHQKKTHDRLQKLVEILTDPSIPEETVIQLSAKNEWTPIRQACSERLCKDAPMGRLFCENEDRVKCEPKLTQAETNGGTKNGTKNLSKQS